MESMLVSQWELLSCPLSPKLAFISDQPEIFDHLTAASTIQLGLFSRGEETIPSVVAIQSLSRVRLCNPMDCSTPGFPVLHHLLEFAQTHGR